LVGVLPLLRGYFRGGERKLLPSNQKENQAREILSEIPYFLLFLKEVQSFPPDCPFRHLIVNTYIKYVNIFFRPFWSSEFENFEFLSFAQAVLSQREDKEIEEQSFSFEFQELKVFSPNRLTLSVEETTSSLIPLPNELLDEEKFPTGKSPIDLIPMRATVPTSECEACLCSPDISSKVEKDFFYFLRRKIGKNREKLPCIKFIRELLALDGYDVYKYRLTNRAIVKNSPLYFLAKVLVAGLKFQDFHDGNKLTVEKMYSALKRQARISHCGKTGHLVAEYSKEGEIKSIKYSPHRCHSLICPVCEFEKSRESLKEVSEVFGEISKDRYIAFWTLTTKRDTNPYIGIEEMNRGLERLRRYKIRKARLERFEELFRLGLQEYEKELEKLVQEGKISRREKRRKLYLQRLFHRVFMNRIEELLEEREYIYFYELGGFVVKIETNVKKKGYNFHAHILTDVLVSKVFLSKFAKEELGLGHIVDVRSAKGEKAVKEIVKYITKTSNFAKICPLTTIIFESALYGVRRIRKWNVPKLPKEEEKEEKIQLKFVFSQIYTPKSDYRNEYRESKFSKEKKVLFLSDLYLCEIPEPHRKRSHYVDPPESERQLIAKNYICDGEYEVLVDYSSFEEMEKRELISYLIRIGKTIFDEYQFSPTEYKVFRKVVKRFFRKRKMKKHYQIFSLLFYQGKIETGCYDEHFRVSMKKIGKILGNYDSQVIRLGLIGAFFYAIAIMNFKYSDRTLRNTSCNSIYDIDEEFGEFDDYEDLSIENSNFDENTNFGDEDIDFDFDF